MDRGNRRKDWLQDSRFSWRGRIPYICQRCFQTLRSLPSPQRRKRTEETKAMCYQRVGRGNIRTSWHWQEWWSLLRWNPGWTYGACCIPTLYTNQRRLGMGRENWKENWLQETRFSWQGRILEIRQRCCQTLRSLPPRQRSWIMSIYSSKQVSSSNKLLKEHK